VISIGALLNFYTVIIAYIYTPSSGVIFTKKLSEVELHEIGENQKKDEILKDLYN